MNDSHTALQLPEVLGHRGACGHAPENTLASIAKAAQLGATWVELDVAITQDGIAVLLHDETLARTTNGQGLLLATASAHVLQLDAGSWFSPQFAQERIPRLEEALALCQQLQLGANLEIKPTQGNELATLEALESPLNGYLGKLPMLLSSYNFDQLVLLKESLPRVPRGYITDVIPRNWQQKLEATQCMSLHCHQAFIDANQIKEIKTAGYQLLSFTVNDQDRARQLLAMGIDGVFSDYPERF